MLAREFAATHPDIVLRAIGHAQADDAAAYDGARCIVNFAFAPELEAQAYHAAFDIDLRIAGLAAGRGIHYLMISSRRVYAPDGQWNATESMPTPGMDAYGRNKARIEMRLHELLGERLTVLRPGNIFGYEPVAGRRRFGAFLQHQLLTHGRLHLTVDPSARRDLVPVGFFCQVLREAVLRRVPGVFNVGAGGATRVGDAARWLLAGYGSGDVSSEATQPADEFQLDSTRLREAFGLSCGAPAVEAAWRKIGARLARER